jgi:hypothetical protein
MEQKKKGRKSKVQIDGNDLETKKKPRTIAEALGYGIEEAYQTDDLEKYVDYLDTLNLAELHRHGLEIAGIHPNSDRNRMYRLLKESFNKYWYNVNNVVGVRQDPKVSPEKQKQVNKVFSGI